MKRDLTMAKTEKGSDPLADDGEHELPPIGTVLEVLLAGGARVAFGNGETWFDHLPFYDTAAVDWEGTRPDGRRTLGRTIEIVGKDAPEVLAYAVLLDPHYRMVATCQIPGSPVLRPGMKMEFRPGSICF